MLCITTKTEGLTMHTQSLLLRKGHVLRVKALGIPMQRLRITIKMRSKSQLLGKRSDIQPEGCHRFINKLQE